MFFFFLPLLSFLLLLLLMDKWELESNDPSKEGSKKRSAVSTDGKRPSKAARTWALSDTRCMEYILVSRRRVAEEDEVDVEHLLKA